MRNRTWSDVIMSLMIALCVTLVAEPQGERSADAARAASAAATPDIADSAQALAVAMLFTGNGARIEAGRDNADNQPARASRSTAERAIANAAEAAGNAASSIEMPFFSFGGDAGAE